MCVLARFGGPKDEQANYLQPTLAGDEMEKRFQKRIKVSTAATHDRGRVSQKKLRNDVGIAPALRPRATRSIMLVGIPELDKVTIEGPFNPVRSEMHQAGRRCSPVARLPKKRDESAPARERSSRLVARRAYRGPVGDTDMTRLIGF